MNAKRTVVVTGTSSGIGSAIRDRLLADGHRVFGISRRAVASPNPRYTHLSLDLAATRDLATELRRKLATTPSSAIDALVSSAGGPIFGHLEQLSEREIRAGVELNLTSHMLVTHALLPLLKKQARSDLIFIGSEASLRGGQRGSVYCAAKFGLRGFAQSLRQECSASGVHVSILNPGMTNTAFFDSLDFAPGTEADNAIEPADIAEAVVMVLGSRGGTVFEEIVISPLKKVVRTKKKDGGS